MTENEKDYEIIKFPGDLHGGKEARRYPDGAIRNEYGWMLAPLPNAHTFTPESGKAAVLARHQAAREQAINGLIKGVEDSGIKLNHASGEEAWMHVVAHMVKTFMSSRNIRGLGEAFTKIGQATGFLDAREEPKENSTPITPEALDVIGRIADMVRDLSPRKTVEGKARDA